MSPTCCPAVEESGAVSDAAVGGVSLVGFDRNQPNHLNPELWQLEVVTVSRNRRMAQSPRCPSHWSGAGITLPRLEQAQWTSGTGRLGAQGFRSAPARSPCPHLACPLLLDLRQCLRLRSPRMGGCPRRWWSSLRWSEPLPLPPPGIRDWSCHVVFPGHDSPGMFRASLEFLHAKLNG